MRVLKWIVLAFAGLGVAIALTLLQHSNGLGDEPLAGNRMVAVWIGAVVWMVACFAAIFVEKRDK